MPINQFRSRVPPCLGVEAFFIPYYHPHGYKLLLDHGNEGIWVWGQCLELKRCQSRDAISPLSLFCPLRPDIAHQTLQDNICFSGQGLCLHSLLQAYQADQEIAIIRDLLSEASGTIYQPKPEMQKLRVCCPKFQRSLHEKTISPKVQIIHFMSVASVLEFLQDCFFVGLSPSMLKVYLVAIAASMHHQAVGLWEDTISCFLCGIRRMRSAVHVRALARDLAMILQRLTLVHFKPIDSVKVHYTKSSFTA